MHNPTDDQRFMPRMPFSKEKGMSVYEYFALLKLDFSRAIETSTVKVSDNSSAIINRSLDEMSQYFPVRILKSNNNGKIVLAYDCLLAEVDVILQASGQDQTLVSQMKAFKEGVKRILGDEIQAIRSSYVRHYGGFVLNGPLPPQFMISPDCDVKSSIPEVAPGFKTSGSSPDFRAKLGSVTLALIPSGFTAMLAYGLIKTAPWQDITNISQVTLNQWELYVATFIFLCLSGVATKHAYDCCSTPSTSQPSLA